MEKNQQILCPQNYDGAGSMWVAPCTRCSEWDGKRCNVKTGAEEFSPAKIVPECPIQDVCQHQVQANPNPCSVRLAGYICASAMEYIGIKVEEHPLAPLAFNTEWM